MRDVPEPVAGADGGEEDAEELSKRDANRRDGSGLDDEEERPAVEEAAEGPERLAQVDVLPARARHHCGQFAVAECADDRHQRGDEPCGDQQRGRADDAAHVCRDDEDAGADHRTHHDGGGGEESHAAHEMGGCGGVGRSGIGWSHVPSVLPQTGEKVARDLLGRLVGGEEG